MKASRIARTMLSSASAERRSHSGFTLVEVVIGGFLMSGLLLVAGFATDRSLDLMSQKRATEAVSSSANRFLQRIASQVVFARSQSMLPAIPMAGGSSTLSFQTCLGAAGGIAQWTPMSTLAWEREVGELDDGLDNNGNGLIDEGMLVFTENVGLPDERRVVWGHGLCEFLPGETWDGLDEDGDGLVDERGLFFSLENGVLTIHVGLQGIGPTGNTITRVVETSVFLRN